MPGCRQLPLCGSLTLLLAPRHMLPPQTPIAPSFLGAAAGPLVCPERASGRTLFEVTADCSHPVLSTA